MLRVLVVLAVMLVALLRGGSLYGFVRLRLRYLPMVLGGLLIQLVIFPIVGDQPLPPALTAALYLLSMALLVGWTWLHRGLPGIVLVGAGVTMNLLAIAANGGLMPVSPAAAAYAGRLSLYGDAALVNNSLASEQVSLWLLTDIFPVPAGIPFATVYSLGDLLLTTGVALLCYRTMLGRPEDRIAVKGTADEHRISAA